MVMRTKIEEANKHDTDRDDMALLPLPAGAEEDMVGPGHVTLRSRAVGLASTYNWALSFGTNNLKYFDVPAQVSWHPQPVQYLKSVYLRA